MASQFDILVAPAGSGKTDFLLSKYREVLATTAKQRELGRTLWLTPTRRSRQFLLDQLLNETLPVCFAPQIFTFETFAEAVLMGTSEQSLLIHDVTRRKLIRNIIINHQHAKELNYFLPVSETTGFLDLVLQFISELKREEVWPQHFEEACQKRDAEHPHGKSLQNKDNELASLYHQYQEGLLAHQWYDREGRFWLARDLMENSNQCERFNQLELVIVDGFTDFTQTQYDMLKILASWATRTVVSLQGDDVFQKGSTDLREELFSKTIVAVNRLSPFDEQKEAADVLNLPASESNSKKDLEQIALHLFRNPRSVVKLADTENIEIVATMGTIGEIETLALSIKRQLLQGVSPDDIVVAHRDISTVAPLFREIFQESGIPCHVAMGLPLSHQPVLKALFAVIDAEINDWQFDALMKLFHNNYFCPDWKKDNLAETINCLATELRKEKLHTSRKLISQNFTRRTEAAEMRLKETDEAPMSEESSAHVKRLFLANRFIQKYEQATAKLLKRHRFSEWVNIIRSVSGTLGIRPIRGTVKEEETEESWFYQQDLRAWDVFDGLLSEAASADDIIESSQLKISLSQFAAELSDMLQTEVLSPGVAPSGCLLVMDVGEVRNLDVKHLYVAGLTEKSFPRTGGEDCIYNDFERGQLGDVGLHIKQNKIGTQDEMLLFYGVITRAKESLHFSYPSVSSTGQPLFPSPYLSAISDLFTKEALQTKQVGQLDPVPSIDCLLTEADLRIVATDRLRHRDAALFRTLGESCATASVAQNILAAAEMGAKRFSEKGFTRYEGMLSQKEHWEVLQNHFDKEYQFSTTQFESYVKCPFQFLMKDILHISPLESPEVATDHRQRGVIAHEILSTLHQTMKEELAEIAAGSPPTPEEMSTRFIQLVKEKFGSQYGNSPLTKTLNMIESRLLAEWGEAYQQQWNDYCSLMEKEWDSQPEVQLWEVPFGNVPHQEGDETAEGHPFLSLGDKENYVRVRGRIDRIDIGEKDHSQYFTVIDYKTGAVSRFKEKDIQTGQSIQLALYLIAVYKLNITGINAEPFQMGYWSLKHKGFLSGFAPGRGKKIAYIDVSVIELIESHLTELLPRLAMEMRSGDFPVENKNSQCGKYCGYSTICRVNQVRSVAEKLEKNWSLRDKEHKNANKKETAKE